MEKISKAIVQSIKDTRYVVLSFIIAMCSFPMTFAFSPFDYWPEGTWRRVMDLALARGWSFGCDIVFTYGPLAFLSTRSNQVAPGIFIFLGDLFLFCGIFHFVHKYISRKLFWAIITIAALSLLRNTNYSQSLFLVFTIYTALNFRKEKSSLFELLYCACAGIILFYIKINYGIISLLIVLALAISLIIKRQWMRLTILGTVSLFLFVLIFLNVHIDIGGYFKNGIPIIRAYEEAMYLPMQDAHPWKASLVITGLFLIVPALALKESIKKREVSVDKAIMACLFLLAFYLFYKNGFTRADETHFTEYFVTMPFLVIAGIVVLELDPLMISRLTAVVTIIACCNAYDIRIDMNSPKHYFEWLTTSNYWKSLSAKPHELTDEAFRLPEKTKKLAGNNTVDLFADFAGLLLYNGLNYSPRPVPQSYSVYSRGLDSLNALHFCKQSRPDMVFMDHGSIDARYSFWDESHTKAVIRMNYEIADSTILNCYILRSKPGTHAQPRFITTGTRTVKLGDTVHFRFKNNEAIYMSAGINYNTWGNMRRLLYKAPALTATLFFDDGTSHEYKAVRPIINNPVLINKAILQSQDVALFYSGQLPALKNITGIAFHGDTKYFDGQYPITFYKFDNY